MRGGAEGKKGGGGGIGDPPGHGRRGDKGPLDKGVDRDKGVHGNPKGHLSHPATLGEERGQGSALEGSGPWAARVATRLWA